MGIYANDGSLNVTVVDGATKVPVYAPNGSINVKVADGLSLAGSYHKSGALNVTSAPTNNQKLKAPDGSLYVSAAPGYTNFGQKVTVVSGSLT